MTHYQLDTSFSETTDKRSIASEDYNVELLILVHHPRIENIE